MRNNGERNYIKIFYFILLLTPFIDSISGYFQNSSIQNLLSNLSQLHRIVLLSYLGIFIFLRKRINWFSFIIIILSLFLPIITSIYIENLASILYEYSNIIKIVIPIFMLEVYRNLEYKSELKDLLTQLLDKFSYIYPLLIVIPRILGLGFNQYYGSGYKGFFYAGNDLNIVFIILFVYNFYKLFEKGEVKNQIINIILIISGLILMGGKAGLLIILLIPIIYLISNRKLSIKIILFLLLIILLYFITFLIFKDFLNGVLNRIFYNYRQYMNNGENLMSFLLSGREKRIYPAIDFWYTDGISSLFYFIFGLGKFTKAPLDNILFDQYAILEMDFLDTFFWYGIIYAILIFTFYHKIIISNRDKKILKYKIALIITIIYSFFLGHVLYSSIVSIFIGVLIILIQKNECEDIND